MTHPLLALVVAIMTSLAPRAARTPDGQDIAAAIARACEADAARGYVDAPLEAAAMAVFAWEESRFQVHPAPLSWDARAHRVCGAWQLSCAFVEAHSLDEQADEWLRLVHLGTLSRVGPSVRGSRARLAIAMGLLERTQGIAESQPD